MFQQKNKHLFMAFLAFLAAVSSSLSDNTKRLAQEGKLRAIDSELYVRARVGTGGSGAVNIMSALTTAQTGITNFNGQTLDAERYFFISSLTVNYGIAEPAILPSAVNYTTALPQALKNANLIIRQDGDVLLNIPIAGINAAKTSEDYYRELGGFVLLRDKTTISIEIDFPNGADLAPGGTTNGYVEVLLRGFETQGKR